MGGGDSKLCEALIPISLRWKVRDTEEMRLGSGWPGLISCSSSGFLDHQGCPSEQKSGINARLALSELSPLTRQLSQGLLATRV